ncbi:superfamily II DNA or RNA helicase [Flavobacterium sp. HSC-32F16]|uniref:DEAD/DEAH box helicase n=1 Tax=Flavobacterium sp. HSC-32F16 TaxID=2910964 RepID=UPI0020A50C2B|nr:superfamily II DNA or RNA helicase [Flavobacterium sp. HSC-32F16]
MEKDIEQLRRLRNNEKFRNNFKNLCLNRELSFDEVEFLLCCSILFFKLYDSDKRFTSYFKIGYYIILKYSISYSKYQALYDISMQLGFYPLIEFVLRKELLKLNTKNIIIDAFAYSLFKNNYEIRQGYVESLEQNNSRENIISFEGNEIAYIAPTSYGKSSIVKDYIKINKPNKIAVIVPTKSLLIQTYLDLKELSGDYKLVLHDEMYSNENKFIGILTQERATRILNRNKRNYYDLLFVDEAHNIFKRDSRSFILARLLQLNYKRNSNQKIIYLSPLIGSVQNLKLKKTFQGEISVKKVNHDFKSFEVYYFNSNKSYFFDRFSGETYSIDLNVKYFDYINYNLKSKNFFYQNKPPTIELFAEKLYNNLRDSKEDNLAIRKIISVLKKEVHKDFKLAKFLSKGVIYLHGKIPNIVKEYIESKYREIDEIKYLVANKVVLEGINMPIETIFITNNRVGKKNISYNDLINLIGRANRLNFIFNDKTLDRLISKIHFLDHEIFQGKRSMKSTMEKLNRENVKDVVENPIAESYNVEELKLTSDERITKQKLEDQKINDFSDFVLEEPKNEFERIKRYCIENSIDNYFENVDLAIQIIIKNIRKYIFNENDKIVDIINEIFVKNQVDNITDFEISRLNEVKARNYYNNFIEVVQHMHLNQRIISTKEYFDKKAKTDDPYLFIGASYGQLTSKEAGKKSKYDEDDEKKYDSKVYIDLSDSQVDLINIAIVKLKIEEDFIGYKITQLISFLHDFEIISNDYYLNIVYGTTNSSIIDLVRFGLSVSTISELRKDDQISNIELDNNGNLRAKNNITFREYLSSKPELFKFEIEKYLN